MGLRQQWNWLLKFGCNAEEANETTQQILCCDSSAALGMIKRKGSTRKMRHIELKAFFLQQWSARPEVRLVPTPNSLHLSRHGTSIPALNVNRFELGRKRSRRSTPIDNFLVDVFLFCFFPFSVARITRSTMNPELNTAHLDRSTFCCLSNFASMEFRVAETIDAFCVVLLFGESRGNSSHVWRSSELHPKKTTRLQV